MDHLPLAEPTAEPPLPRRATLTLLVGRVTTIKLAYWAALTAFEAALPIVVDRPFAERFSISMAGAAVLSIASLAWARYAARARDRVVGVLTRSIPTIATTFAATTVVASPASLPLLILERERSLCSVPSPTVLDYRVTCHGEALLLWVAVVAVGTIFIPLAFALSLRSDRTARSLGN